MVTELILTCRVCGHKEHGDTAHALMAKVRLYNHLVREHPVVADRFKEVTEEHQLSNTRQ